MVSLSSTAQYCVCSLNISHSHCAIFPMLNGSFTAMTRLKSIQIKFHPIELTLGQENVHVSFPGVLIEDYLKIVFWLFFFFNSEPWVGHFQSPLL